MSDSLRQKPLHIIFILISGVLWGTIGLYTTALGKIGLDSVSVTAVRSLLTAIMLGFFLLCTDRKLFRPRWRDLWAFFGMGVVSFSFFNICYFQSMRYNSLGTACILLYTAPVFVTLLSAVLFREKITPVKLLCLALAVGGCALVSGGGSMTGRGFLFGICSGFGYALYSIFSVYALRRNHFFTAIFYAFVLAAVCLAPFCDWKAVAVAVSSDYQAGLWLIGMALFTTVLPYILYTCGLKTVPAGEASVIACVEPLVANLLGIVVFAQTPTLASAVGIALILVAVAALGLSKK